MNTENKCKTHPTNPNPWQAVFSLIKHSCRHSFEQWLPVEEAEEVCQHSPALLWRGPEVTGKIHWSGKQLPLWSFQWGTRQVHYTDSAVSSCYLTTTLANNGLPSHHNCTECLWQISDYTSWCNLSSLELNSTYSQEGHSTPTTS